MGPAGRIEYKRLKLGDLTIAHGNKGRPLGAGFSDVAALEIAGENNMRILVKHFPLMDVSERPVIVVMRDELIERTGCIWFVPFATVARGVQYPDIIPAGLWRWVVQCNIFFGVWSRKTPTMHRDFQVSDLLGLSAP